MTDDSPDAPDIPGFVYERLLASGGFAHVHLYLQLSPRRLVAVKVARAEKLTARSREDFIAEANAMAALAHHPFIVSVHSVDTLPDGRPYLVMDYYPGDTLRQQSLGHGLPLEKVLEVGIQIGSAVETAHQAGLLHCDIKPSNLLTNDFAPGLTDFGIAAAVDADQPRGNGLSIAFAAPEVIRDVHQVSVASDVYSLGATLWALLAGRTPFELLEGPNDDRSLADRSLTAPRPPTRRPDVPASLEGLLRRCLAMTPTGRPASADEVIRTLQNVQRERRLPLTPLALRGAAPRVTGEPDIGTGTGSRVPPPVDRAPTATVAPFISGVPPHLDEEPRSAVPVHRTRAAPVTPRPPDLTVSNAPGEAPEAETPAARPLGRGRRYAIAAGVLAVVAAGAVAALHATGSTAAQPPTEAPPSVSQDALPDTTPAVPVVTAQRQGTQIVYSWTYDSRLDGDAYRWRTADGARSGTTTAPTVSLPAVGGAGDCLEVLVVRASGAGSGWSPAACPPG